MSEAYQPAQILDVCAAYRRQIALAQLDLPPGEARQARESEALERCAEVSSLGALTALQGQIAEAPAASQEVLQRLLSWGSVIHMQRALEPYQRELQTRQRQAVCVVDAEPIPLLASFAAMAREPRRERRAAIEAAVGEQLGALDDLFEAQFATLQRVASALDFGSLDAFWARMLPMDPGVLEEVATRVLAETHEVYVDLLHWAVKRRLDIPPGQLRRHDVLALFPFAEYHRYYQPGVVSAALSTCLRDMGLDPLVDGRLTLRRQDDSFGLPQAVALDIPHEIVLSHGTVGGLKGAEAFASAYGRALLWASTVEEMPLASRLLGDPAIPAGNAQLFAEMVALPQWLRHYAQVTVDSNYRLWRRLDRLYRLRRQLGRFLYTRHLYHEASLTGAPEAYRDIMREACQVDHAPAYHFLDWDWQYTSSTFFYSWVLAYTFLKAVRQQFAEDWFRHPDAGMWLSAFWHGALAEKAESLVQHLDGVAWDAARFAELFIHEELW